jgi:hypothetical protein
MSSIRQLPSGNYRVLIRIKGSRAFSRTFSSLDEANHFSSYAEDMVRKGINIDLAYIDENITARSLEMIAKFLWKNYKNRVVFRARSKGINAILTEEDVSRIVVRSNGRCEVTNVRLVPSTDGLFGEDIKNSNPFMPSIDRIDSSRGYEPRNVRVVCYAANLAMNRWGEHVLSILSHGYVNSGFKAHEDLLVAEHIFNKIKSR